MSTEITRVVSLDTLRSEMRRVAEQATDAADRSDYHTDEFLRGELSILVHLADCCVWSRANDFSEQEIAPLRIAAQSAQDAMDYLRSGAPAIQRTLKQPEPQELAWIAAHVSRRWSMSGATCAIHNREFSNSALKKLRIPGSSCHMGHAVFRCRKLSDAKRILRAVGLTPRYVEENGVRIIVCAESPNEYVEQNPA